MTEKTNLFSGYKHVESFGPDEEYEDDVEECYVTLDLGSVEPTLVPNSSTFRIAGLNTDTPFMQISGTVLKGKHSTLLGTELIFRDNSEDDSVDRSRPTVQHIASTDHRIKFRVVELKPKRNLSEAQVVMDPHTLQLQQETNDDDADVPELDSSGEVNTGGSARRDKGKGVDRGVGEEFAEVQGEASARMEVD